MCARGKKFASMRWAIICCYKAIILPQMVIATGPGDVVFNNLLAIGIVTFPTASYSYLGRVEQMR